MNLVFKVIGFVKICSKMLNFNVYEKTVPIVIDGTLIFASNYLFLSNFRVSINLSSANANLSLTSRHMM